MNDGQCQPLLTIPLDPALDPSQPVQDRLESDTIQACLDTDEEQRKGIIMTSQATMRLVRLLPGPSSIHALQCYTKKLDEINHLHENTLQ